MIQWYSNNTIKAKINYDSNICLVRKVVKGFNINRETDQYSEVEQESVLLDMDTVKSDYGKGCE